MTQLCIFSLPRLAQILLPSQQKKTAQCCRNKRHRVAESEFLINMNVENLKKIYQTGVTGASSNENKFMRKNYLTGENHLGFPRSWANWIAAVFVAITPIESLIRAAS